MKNLTKKTFAVALTAAVVASMAATSAFAQNADTVATDDGIKNEFLEIKRTGSYSRFTIHAFDENNNSLKLLFDTTSNFIAKIDEDAYELNSLTNDSIVSGDSISDSGNIGGSIECTRTLTFIPNKVNGNKNVVEIKHTVKNVDKVSHEVGGRVMLDTMLDTNDYAPFRIQGVGATTTKLQFDGDEIPAMYQAFDSLEKPTIVSTGYFATGSLKPDHVQFNNYWKSVSNYYPSPDIGAEIGDSAVNSIWEPVTLAPNESRDYITYYGLGELDVANGSLTLGATRSTSSFEVNAEGTGYNPIAITTYLKNTSNVEVKNAKVTVELPDGVYFANDSTSANYDTLAQSAEEQNTWTINAKPSGVERTVTVKISASADGINNVEPIEYTFTIPAVELPTEPTTVAPTTVAPTTAAPTTIAPTTVAPATETTSAQPTTKAATPSQVNKPATIDSAANTGKVATGDSRASFILLATVACAAGITVILSRKKAEE